MTKNQTKIFIEKAIEGGWELFGDIPIIRVEETTNANIRLIWKGDQYSEGSSQFGNGEEHTDIRLEVILLDPEVWKAVGKVEGWHIVAEEFDDISDEHRTKMHQMINALCEGKSPEEFIKTLKLK